MTTLLEKAKTLKRQRKNVFEKHPRSQAIELAVGWLKGDVNITMIAQALNETPGSQVYVFLSQALKAAHEDGRLLIYNEEVRHAVK